MRVEPFDAFAESPELDLEAGAALVARDDNPSLTVADVAAALDEVAEGCPEVGHLPIEKGVAILADHLYNVLGFRGDDQTYGDPRNSRIDEVIARRRGIPITLAIVFLGLAKRRGVTARGVSFPGHFPWCASSATTAARRWSSTRSTAGAPWSTPISSACSAAPPARARAS